MEYPNPLPDAFEFAIRAPRRFASSYEEWAGLNNVSTSETGYVLVATGATEAEVAPDDNTRLGINRITLTAGSDNGALFRQEILAIPANGFGAGRFAWQSSIRSDTAPDATEDYFLACGVCEQAAGLEYPTDGVFFFHDKANANWLLVARSGSTEDTLDTGIAFAADTWFTLGFVIAADGASVTAYVNGAAKGVLTSAKIQPAVDVHSVAIHVERATGVAGTGSVLADVDFTAWAREFTAAR